MEFPSGDVAISQQVKNLPRLRLNDGAIQDFVKAAEASYKPLFEVRDRASFLGIEVEVENVRDFAQSTPFWIVTEDGSLRNRGREFISVPIRAVHAELALYYLLNKELNKTIDFSERTSIHIHMNIRSLTPKQLFNLVLAYTIFEKTLFTWVGHNREHSIFCNPLVTTPEIKLLPQIVTNMPVGFNWNKYCALNLAPIWSKGTIEFRHLHGTRDLKTIMFWINCLLSLKVFALQTNPDKFEQEIRTLNTLSTYHILGQRIFGNAFKELSDYPNFEQDCYLGTCSIKERVFDTQFHKNTTIVTPNSNFSTVYNKLLQPINGRARAVRMRTLLNPRLDDTTQPLPEVPLEDALADAPRIERVARDLQIDRARFDAQLVATQRADRIRTQVAAGEAIAQENQGNGRTITWTTQF